MDTTVHRTIRRFAILAAVLMISGLAVFAWVRSQRSLIQRSVVIADVKGWWEDRIGATSVYEWLDHRTLFSHSGWWRLQFPFTYDVQLHRKTPLTALEKVLNSSGDLTIAWELIPESQMLVWNMDCEDDIHTARLDGTQHRIWKSVVDGVHRRLAGVSWQADGQGWIVKAGFVDSTLDDGYFTGRLDSKNAKADFHATDYGIERYKTVCDFDESSNSIKAYRLTAPGIAPRWVALAAPDGAKTVGVELNIARTRLLWIIQKSYVPRWGYVLHTLRLRPAPEEKVYTAICVSRPDGSHLREVGRVDIGGDDPDDLNARWRPDSQEISYVFNDKLYVVSAEE